MLIDQDHITELIPQRAPFVMIDTLEYHADGKTGTRFRIRPDNIFLREGRLETAALIENLAQTAAASAGLMRAPAVLASAALGNMTADTLWYLLGYHGKLETRPPLGTRKPAAAGDIDKALVLVQNSIWLWLLAVALIGVLKRA